MDIQSIKSFVQVANLGSFTRAAQELRYAQSTVTMQIQRLEEELGFPLFERIGRNSYLTTAGQEFLPHAVQILHIMQKASTFGRESEELKGTLRIGVLESLLFSGVLPILPQFRQEFPQVEVFLKIGQASELLAQLKQNQLDLIYISCADPADAAVHCCYRRIEKLIFVAGAAHPLAQAPSISIRQALACPFIVAEHTGHCYTTLQSIAREQQFPLSHSVTVDSIAAIANLLQDQQSLTFLPEYALREDLDAGKLCKLQVDYPTQIYYSQLLYHRNKWVSPYMERFIHHIHRHRPERD